VSVRGALCTIALLLTACVGTNPRWDRTDVDGGRDDHADDVGDSVGETSGEVDTTASAESSWTAGEDATTADDGLVCKPDEQVCAGECKKTMSDRHACGPDCVDCMDLHGSDAECRDGECRDGESKGDD
jgi:hypothetical protein